MKAIAIALGLFVMLAVSNPIRGGEPNRLIVVHPLPRRVEAVTKGG